MEIACIITKEIKDNYTVTIFVYALINVCMSLSKSLNKFTMPLKVLDLYVSFQDVWTLVRTL